MLLVIFINTLYYFYILFFMRFFSLFNKSNQPAQSNSTPINFTTAFNEVVKQVFATLKPIGFQKKERTVNREIEKGIFQVVNFQKSKDSDRFTVNIGVCAAALYQFHHSYSKKDFYLESDCQLRQRLGVLVKGDDYWWTIDNTIDAISKEIGEYIHTTAFKWFADIDTKEKIINHMGVPPYRSSSNDQLQAALFAALEDKAKGKLLFEAYIKTLSNNPLQQAYVQDLAKETGIELSS